MDAATLEQDVSAELKRGKALCANAILGVWVKELAEGSFGAEHCSTPAQANPGEGRYVPYA